MIGINSSTLCQDKSKYSISSDNIATLLPSFRSRPLVPGVAVSVVVCEVQFGLFQVEAHARGLGHDLGVDCFTRLDAHHQLVPDRRSGEDVARNVPVLDPHLRLALVEGLAGTEDEGNPLPPESIGF